MNRILFLILILGSAACSIAQQKTLSDFGVVLNFSADDHIFPESWLSKEINGKAISLDSVEYKRSEKAILKALNKYPVHLIKKNLTKIYVVKRLEFYGLKYGGTNSTAIVYIANQGADNGYTDFWLEKTFHHEFSSILLRNFSSMFNNRKWISSNRDIKYGKSGVEALKLGKDSEEFDETLNKRGILSQYGTASMEEDFNTFAENLFLSSEGFWKIESVHNRIKNKVKQIVQFYNKIDNRFNEEYFRVVSKQ